ncbi:PREDICTED: F-box/kelch-repeat protein At1g64840-like [Camelina sativa]|uniref:F-box/kelch-repeat protein At1g64840-like n=1 Tax=Camelina sativa TaxID=90675 RepID=A0ABM0TPU6_CAMSA|nr:PREDICTED: F-box/kelch-repeat protein At1g64840-like [Camelina sativa]
MMAEPATETSSIDCSLLLDCVSKLQLSPATKEQTPEWSLLPGELLQLILTYLDNCFEVVHVRSVCTTWRSAIPFPSCLLRLSYSLPTFADFPYDSRDLCILEKIPLFLFRVRDTSPCEYFLGDIGLVDESENHYHMEPLQCTVKVKIPGSEKPTLMNMLDCQIIPLGHQYRMIGWDPEAWTSAYRGVALLPLNKQGGGFVVLLNYTKVLLVLTSGEMRWMRVKKFSDASCWDLFIFRGRFYAVFLNGEIFVIDPCSLEATPLKPSQLLNSSNYLVPSGDDELFLVEKIVPRYGELDYFRLVCRVSRLDEEAGEWVVVSDLGDRVLFIGELGNFSFSAKELPPGGCGVSGNSVLFTNGPGNVTYAYRYDVETGNLSFWRFSRENRVMILNRSPPVLALQVER